MSHLTKKALKKRVKNNLNRGYSSLEVKYVGTQTHRNPKTDYSRVKIDAVTGRAYTKYA